MKRKLNKKEEKTRQEKKRKEKKRKEKTRKDNLGILTSLPPMVFLGPSLFPTPAPHLFVSSRTPCIFSCNSCSKREGKGRGSEI